MAKGSGRSGRQNAAILLMSLGEREAARVMRHLDVADVRKLSESMKDLGVVTRDVADGVLSDFSEIMSNEGPVSSASSQFIHRMLTDSIGEQQAEPFVERLFPAEGSAVASLQLMQPPEIIEALHAEHPQVIAIALACLDKEKSAAVLADLPVALASEVVARIARMEEISEAAIAELEHLMHQKFTQSEKHKAKSLGGIRAAAEILNYVGKSVESALLEELANTDSELSQEVKDNMLVFESLDALDDRGMQTLLRDVDTRSLSVALKGASSTFKNLVFRNMSKRAAELLQSDLEAMGPVKLSDVEAAQKQIVEAAKGLADDGKINLGGGAEELL
jgi:flagellar motor switch protein FliG